MSFLITVVFFLLQGLMDAMVEERVKPAWVTVVLLSCSSLEQHCISGELSLLRSLWCPHLEVFLCIMVIS